MFNHYRLDDVKKWNVRIGWCKLSHVCRRWRHLIHESVFYLNMHLICTNGSPVVDVLTHLPPMPIAIDYQYATTIAPAGALDIPGISHALQLRDRVRRVVLHMPSSSLENILMLMDEPFPILEQLSITSTTEGRKLILPETFLVLNLRHLTLPGISLLEGLAPSSTASLITLTLMNIRAADYFLPKHLVAHLSSSPQLEALCIGFSVPLPRPSAEWELLNALGPPVTLPRLKSLTFRGVTAYLDSLVAQIRAPQLRLLDITLFNQVAFVFPHLVHFTNTTLGLKLPVGKIFFNYDSASIVTNRRSKRRRGKGPSGFHLRVICTQFDWQIDSMAQICRSLMPLLSSVEKLTLDFDGQEMPIEWQHGAVDRAAWPELLQPFVGVNMLRVCRALAWELSDALQSHDVALTLDLLPVLQTLVHEQEVEAEHIENAFVSFVEARRIADRPVCLMSPRPPVSAWSSPSGFRAASLVTLSRYREVVCALNAWINLTLLLQAPLAVISTATPESIFALLLKKKGLPWILTWTENIPFTLPVRIEEVIPPPLTARSVRSSVKIQPAPPKHIRSRIRPSHSHKGAGSAWR